MLDREEFSAYVFGFLLGGLIGGILALMFAPQSGQETRSSIQAKYIELREKASQTAEEILAHAKAVEEEMEASEPTGPGGGRPDEA